MMTDPELKTEIKKICRAHERLVGMMEKVQNETDIDFGVYVSADANEIVIVRGIKRIAEVLKAEVSEIGAQYSVQNGQTQISSFWLD